MMEDVFVLDDDVEALVDNFSIFLPINVVSQLVPIQGMRISVVNDAIGFLTLQMHLNLI
jgi:hypothetical protein